MTGRGRLYWDDAMTGYDFGPSHPMQPLRLELMMRLARDLGVLDAIEVSTPRQASLQDLTRVHSAAFVDAVQRASAAGAHPDYAYGLGTPDVPVFEGMHEVTSLIAGASLDAAHAVWRGGVKHAFNPAGGLHHAMPASAGGFCVYNDVAVAIAALLEAGVERVAYVDVDVHHGDGVQAAFWNDPRVLTISLHQHPHTLYPGTGWPDERGGPHAEGCAVNVALPPGVGDDDWLRALYAVVPPLLGAFSPDVLVSQHGCDTHLLDPLANMQLSVDAERVAAESLHRWAHEYTQGRWIATGGGGYAIVDVVPRIWTLVMAEVAGHPIAPGTRLPESWRLHIASTLDRLAPMTMTDGVEPQVPSVPIDLNPSDAVDDLVLQTLRSVFPLHGLDADRD